MIKLATAFSGIGAVEQAFKQLGLEHNIVFACDNGERYLKQSQEELLDIIKNESKKTGKTQKQVIEELYDQTGKINYVKKSYFANYKITEDNWYEDVRFLSGIPYAGKVDLFVGGSPCQSFSTYGKKRGLEDTRGTLFYEYARLASVAYSVQQEATHSTSQPIREVCMAKPTREASRAIGDTKRGDDRREGSVRKKYRPDRVRNRPPKQHPRRGAFYHARKHIIG